MGVPQMKIIKQVMGIDVSKDSLSVSIGSITDYQEQRISKPVAFDNTKKGFKALLAWGEKSQEIDALPLLFVMEATGVYYESLAYFLAEHKQQVVVLLPNKARHYAKTLDIKSKTDKIDAMTLTRFGLERPLQLWQVPNPVMRTLKVLTREYESIKVSATQVKNQVHHSYLPPKETLKRLQQQLALLEKQLKAIERQIKELIAQDPSLEEKIKKIIKIKGLGLMTIVTIIAETNGFALIENTKQLASYAGLDVVHQQSGLKEKKTSISKKGNKQIRRALYMPAISACRFNAELRSWYLRLCEKKNIKKIGVIAVARKLLTLIYTLWKNNTDYNPQYHTTMATAS